MFLSFFPDKAKYKKTRWEEARAYFSTKILRRFLYSIIYHGSNRGNFWKTLEKH